MLFNVWGTEKKPSIFLQSPQGIIENKRLTFMLEWLYTIYIIHPLYKGMAWTAVGGETMVVEASRMPVREHVKKNNGPFTSIKYT